MTSFADITDYTARYGPVADEARVGILLQDATALLLSEYEAFWSKAYFEGLHDAFDRACVAVCCKLAHNALSAPAGFEGATQYSQGAGGYTASVSFDGALGNMWLSKADREALGLAGQRMGALRPYERDVATGDA